MEFIAATKKQKRERWAVDCYIRFACDGHIVRILPKRGSFGYLGIPLTATDLQDQLGRSFSQVDPGIYEAYPFQREREAENFLVKVKALFRGREEAEQGDDDPLSDRSKHLDKY